MSNIVDFISPDELDVDTFGALSPESEESFGDEICKDVPTNAQIQIATGQLLLIIVTKQI